MTKCDKCGICCKIFYVPLTEEEFLGRKFEMMFKVLDIDFKEVEKNGWNLLKRNNKGCVYLAEGKCLVHSDKPKYCREFFCKDPNANKAMIEEIEKIKKNSE